MEAPGTCVSGAFFESRLQAQTRKMFDPARRDDYAVYPGRVEDEAQRGFRHRLLACFGRVSQPLDRTKGLFAQITAERLGRLSEAACSPENIASASGLKAV